jgi:hypothetical protein
MFVEHLPSVECPPILCIYPCSACTPPIPLYSLVPITPCCSVANRQVARVASYSLANSGWSTLLVPPSYSRFGLVFARGPAGRGLIGARRLCAAIWLVGSFSVPTGSVAGSVWDRGTTWDRGKGYVLLYSCTHSKYAYRGARLIGPL